MAVKLSLSLQTFSFPLPFLCALPPSFPSPFTLLLAFLALNMVSAPGGPIAKEYQPISYHKLLLNTIVFYTSIEQYLLFQYSIPFNGNNKYNRIIHSSIVIIH